MEDLKGWAINSEAEQNLTSNASYITLALLELDGAGHGHDLE